MTNNHHESGRRFLAAAGAVAALPAIDQLAFAKDSDQVRIGLIGVGIRGYELHRDIVQSPLARLTAISDMSDHYLERIGPELSDPQRLAT